MHKGAAQMGNRSSIQLHGAVYFCKAIMKLFFPGGGFPFWLVLAVRGQEMPAMSQNYNCIRAYALLSKVLVRQDVV